MKGLYNDSIAILRRMWGSQRTPRVRGGVTIRVLFVAAHLGKGGGVALQAYRLFAELRRHIEVELVCLDAPGPHRDLNDAPGVSVAGPLTFPRGIETLARVLRSRRSRHDLFQLWDAYFTFPAAYLARVSPRVACLGTDPGLEIEGRYGKALGAFTRAAMGPLLSRTAVVTNSRFLASRFRAHHPRVIPNGLNLGSFEGLPSRPKARERLGLPAGRTILVTVGKVIPEKRVQWLLEVTRRLPDTVAVIVGGTTEEHYGDRYYRGLLHTYRDLGRRMIFTGEVPWGRVPLHLAAADVFVFPSPWEGSPNAVLEAMAAGTPVVASDIPPHREIIEPGSTGFLADSIASMTEGVARLASDPELACAVGARARAAVFERYSFEACAQAYLALYREILDGRRAPQVLAAVPLGSP